MKSSAALKRTESSVPEERCGIDRLGDLICSTYPTDHEIVVRTKAIYDEMLRDSPNIREGHITVISGLDLEKLCELYDERFFGGALREVVNGEGKPKLSFRISQRMTSAGGKTTRHLIKHSESEPRAEVQYEIAIASTLLFQTFSDVERTISVNGIVCHDRLEALQRIFEHELVHLLEWLLWGKTSCKAENFRIIARNFFGHTEVTHRLVTQRERAREIFGIRVRDRVAFEYEGERFEGRVNRITKRATVLVPNDEGSRYSDGGRYDKYYIPLALLEKLG